MTILENMGKSAKDTPFYNLAFYDEEARWDINKYTEYISDKARPNLLYLGEPSFVLKNDDGEKWLRLELKEDLGQNILLLTAMAKNRERYLYMLMLNLLSARNQGHKIQVSIIYANKEMFKSTDLGLCDKPLYTREYNTSTETACKPFLWRKLMIECDEMAFNKNIKPDEKDLVAFENHIKPTGKFDSELWQRRALILYKMFRDTYAPMV